ncbi:DNA/RNA non-specific endonuclease [Oecophyllibacter saccharovorans]|uniref:DNA/RNA non-specific endonuclease n=2 Tax=Oecophyllibacter saccharovorans TaxID=2558360 RepID=A0A506UQI2_9PROT|nr:DNA/RNA non-specific endonuclease [Oecophyllibacter saccharovorans]
MKRSVYWIFSRISLAGLFALMAAPAVAAPQDNCSWLGPGQLLPQSGQLLCSDEFAVGYSASDREPLWSAEHLTAETLQQAETLHHRPDGFHADKRLPETERSELDDYARSGWGRGHLAPSGDMSSWQARKQSFTLSNVIPQNETLNSGMWEKIEAATRRLAWRDGELYIVTGPAFREARGFIGPDRVRVPSSIWKAVYDPRRRATSVVVCRNETRTHCAQGPVNGLERITGIDPFPGLPLQIRDHYVPLPLLPVRTTEERRPAYRHRKQKTASWFERLLQ